MTLQHPGERADLVGGGRPKVKGASDVGGAVRVLGARVAEVDPRGVDGGGRGGRGSVVDDR